MAQLVVRTSFTSVSWIPAEAMTGLMRLPMDVGLGRYDLPPPDQLDDVEALVAAGGCRFANRLTAWAEITDGTITASGSDGGGLVAETEVDLRAMSMRIAAIPFPEIRTTETGERSVTFVQTAGGRTGAPFPRRAGGTGRRLRMKSPTAWTTLAVTIDADGAVTAEARGASPFPRHWFYDDDGHLVSKSGTVDFDLWTSGLHESDTPWGDAEHQVLAAETESPLERALSQQVMANRRRSSIKDFQPGQIIMAQGERAVSMDLILDGMVEIEVDGTVVAECGPGSILGERAFVERGERTSTVRAITRVKTVKADPQNFTEEELEDLRRLHQREYEPPA